MHMRCALTSPPIGTPCLLSYMTMPLIANKVLQCKSHCMKSVTSCRVYVRKYPLVVVPMRSNLFKFKEPFAKPKWQGNVSQYLMSLG